MSSKNQEIRTKAIVLRRTKYQETDRILSLLTPIGKKSVIAKGVRKEKSKLAGGIEIFTISDITIHESKNNGLGILTSARMVKSYIGIIEKLEYYELGSKVIKVANKIAEHTESPELFTLVESMYEALTNCYNLSLIDAYFTLNITRISGEEINLYRDLDGEKLCPENRYNWSPHEKTLVKNLNGLITAEHIKLLRIFLNAPIKTVLLIKDLEKYLPEIIKIAKTFNQ